MKNVQNIPEKGRVNRSKFIETFQKNDFDLMEDRTLNDWASKQTYLLLANMMTSAALLKIDSCPIEGFVAKDLKKILKENLGIDLTKFGVSCMVAFGYRINEPRPKTRHTMKEIVK